MSAASALQSKALAWIARKRVRLRDDYKNTFSTVCGFNVLKDLYCEGVERNVGYIEKATAEHMQGRLWMFVRITKMMRMSDQQLRRLIAEETDDE